MSCTDTQMADTGRVYFLNMMMLTLLKPLLDVAGNA